VFVKAKHKHQEQASDDDQWWPPAGRVTVIARTTASALAAHGPSALLLDPVEEWQLASDLEQLVFPADSGYNPAAIVIWSLTLKSVILIELTVTIETNM